MPTIFTKIVNGDIPCYKIAEDENYLAFLDINPLCEGHTLCIPKKEIDYYFDMDDDLLSGLTVFSKKVALAIDQVINCERVGVAIVGLEVPHAHVHLIPINDIGDINFNHPKLQFSTEEFESIAERIRNAIT
jgi:histidine triad (HIT) family protein